MIIIDTNVISEATRPNGDPRVRAWLDALTPRLFLCAPVLAEIRAGIERLPAGRKKSAHETACDDIEKGFASRMLPFDQSAARPFGRILAIRRAKGRPIEAMDAMIASIALANNMAIATRNIYDFDELGIDLVNPFDAP